LLCCLLFFIENEGLELRTVRLNTAHDAVQRAVSVPPIVDSSATSNPASSTGVFSSSLATERPSKLLKVDLWLGSMLAIGETFSIGSFEALTCIEVIEHLSSEAEALTAGVVALQRIEPNIAIFTTPNYEANQLLSRLSGDCLNESSMDSGVMPFREADHKFEWTRSQLRDWAAQVCSKLRNCCEQHKSVSPYTVEFADIGSLAQHDDGASIGGASQAAIFRRRCQKSFSTSVPSYEVSSAVAASPVLGDTNDSIFAATAKIDDVVLYRSTHLAVP
jgi:hypothetical protein